MIKKYNRYVSQEEITKDIKEDYDIINHPKHYEGNIECIDAMQEVIGKVGVIDFCIGNAFKYIWRCMKKHKMPIEDLKKCRWYINKALDLMEIADCMLEGKQGSGTQEEINEKATKIIDSLCGQIEGCENCIYNNASITCEPMEFIDKLEKGKEKG